MNKVKKSYTIRAKTIRALREHSVETGHAMSLIVDLAVEEYVEEYIERKKNENR